MNDPAGAGPHRNWPLRLGLAAVVLCAAVAVLLGTGWPQRAFVKAALSARLDARVEVGAVSLWNGVSIARLRIADREGRPALEAEGLRLGYALFPKDGRYVPALEADAATLSFPGLGAIAGTSRKGAAERPNLSVIPRRVSIQTLTLAADTPSLQVAAGGLRFEAAIDSFESIEARLSGDSVSVQARTWGTSPQISMTGGSVDVGVKGTGDALAVAPVRVSGPGLVELNASALVHGSPDARRLDATLEQCVLENIDFSRADPADLRVPFAFQRLDLSGTRAEAFPLFRHAMLDSPVAAVQVAAKGLRLGPPGREYYEGDLTLDARNTGGPGLDLTLEAALGLGQKVNLDAKGYPSAFVLHAKAGPWSRQDLLGALPAGLRANAAAITGLEAVEAATVTVQCTYPRSLITAELEPVFETPAGRKRAHVTCEGAITGLGAPDAEWGPATVRAQSDGATLAVDLRPADTGARELAATLDGLDPVWWVQALSGYALLPGLSTRLAGTVTGRIASGAQTADLAFDLAARPFQYGAFAVPEGEALTIRGKAALGRGAARTVSGPELEVRAGEQASVVFRDWTLAVDDFAARAGVTGSLSLALLEPWVPGKDLRGDITFQGPLTNDRGIVSLPVEAVIEGLGYGGVSAPYSTPIEARGRVFYDTLNRRGGVAEPTASLGEGTTLTADEWKLRLGPFRLEAPYTLHTDLRPLIPMGLLQSVDGSGAATGAFEWGEHGPRLTADFTAQADNLIAARAIAAIEGAGAEGRLQYTTGGQLEGEGAFRARKAGILGIPFEEVAGPLAFGGTRLRSAGLAGRLFNGKTNAGAGVGVLEPGWPCEVDARLEDIDLAAFCQAMAPPSVMLTGLAHGTATLRLDTSGMKGLQFDLESSERLSVNLELLERLMEAQYSKSFVGKQKVEKAMAEILGKEPQRPFDSGRITLSYEGERLGGQAALKSKSLDLTVDLQVDPAAIAEALELAQQARLEEFEMGADEEAPGAPEP